MMRSHLNISYIHVHVQKKRGSGGMSKERGGSGGMKVDRLKVKRERGKNLGREKGKNLGEYLR